MKFFRVTIILLVVLPTFVIASGGKSVTEPSELEKFLFHSELKTEGLIISKGDKEFETYRRGYDKKTRHISWSLAKSFTNGLIGFAVTEKKIKLSDKIGKWYPRLSAKKKEITIEHLLTYTAGLAWNEDYDLDDVKKSDVLQILYGEAFKDMTAYILAKELKYTPGSTAQYNTATAVVLGQILKKIYKSNYDSFIGRFFSHLGTKDFNWVKDGSGSILGGSNLYATPRTFHNFGKLFLNDGVVAEKRVLPEGWVSFSSKRPKTKRVLDHEDIPGVPLIESLGALFWLNIPVNGETSWKDSPKDAYVSWGHWGQFIIIIPSEGVVITRTAQDKVHPVDVNKLIKYSLKFIKDGGLK